MSKILFVNSTEFYPLLGGIERVSDTLAREFIARGHQVFYLIYKSTPPEEIQYSYPAPLFFLPSRQLLDEENINFYIDFIRNNNIKIIINQSGNFSESELWIKGRSENTKIISVLHCEPWMAYRHLWNYYITFKENTFAEWCRLIARVIKYPKIKINYKQHRIKQFEMLLPITDKICMLTKRYYPQLSEIYPGYHFKYCSVSNPNTYKSSEIDDFRILRQKKKKQIIVVCRFVQEKRVDRALSIWKTIENRFPDWELIIIGDGHPEYVSYIHNLAAGCQRVTFTGCCDPKPYYETASILIHTANYEGWPMVLTESMQHGVVPIAFSSSAGIIDIFNNGDCGILIKPFNMTLFKKELIDLMNDPSRLNKLSHHAFEHVKQYDIKNIADKWEILFSSLQ